MVYLWPSRHYSHPDCNLVLWSPDYVHAIQKKNVNLFITFFRGIIGSSHKKCTWKCKTITTRLQTITICLVLKFIQNNNILSLYFFLKKKKMMWFVILLGILLNDELKRKQKEIWRKLKKKFSTSFEKLIYYSIIETSSKNI